MKVDTRVSDQDAGAWLLERLGDEAEVLLLLQIQETVGWLSDRGCRWRSLSCEQRCWFLAGSIFDEGLRCGPVGLVTLLTSYRSLDAGKCSSVVDMIQDSGLGRATVEHFLSTTRSRMQMIEATVSLRGNVEVDGAFLSSFPISVNNPHYDQIWKIQNNAGKKAKKVPSRFPVLIQHPVCLC